MRELQEQGPPQGDARLAQASYHAAHFSMEEAKVERRKELVTSREHALEASLARVEADLAAATTEAEALRLKTECLTTNLNRRLAASHTIVSMFVWQECPRDPTRAPLADGTPASAPASWERRTAVARFADLAGVEWLAAVPVPPEATKPGYEDITVEHVKPKLLVPNTSEGGGTIHTLRRCVSVLREAAAHSRKAVYVPHQGSAVTSILRSALGGSAASIWLGCVAPGRNHAAAIVDTMEFFQLLRGLHNRPTPHAVVHPTTLLEREGCLLDWLYVEHVRSGGQSVAQGADLHDDPTREA
jgi:hypothetical protein